ncbi:MAG: hypothetical protein DMG10_13940 [Acidobacteria bacterium]|nr:MAG: hypothetical protein DMG10_13940 [Acidobacteriota bacterium]
MKLSRKVCREGGVSMSKKICLAGSLLVLAAALCLAQTGASRISGTVTDSSGAVVPGVTVTAKNEATGVTHTQITTARGLYAFPALPVGSYTIIAELAGFKTTQKTGNILVVDTPLVVDVVLQVGGVSEVVNVEGGYEKLQSSNATLGNVVEQKAIVDLPLNGRNPLTLITLEPGVVQRSFGGAGSGIHVNGSRDRAFNVTIDGIEANESSVPNPVSNLYRLNPDNVQEYKVTTNNATPEEGRNSGASVSVATRGGTNQFHGTAYEFLRNTALNSNEFFANALGAPKPEIKLHAISWRTPRIPSSSMGRRSSGTLRRWSIPGPAGSAPACASARALPTRTASPVTTCSRTIRRKSGSIRRSALCSSLIRSRTTTNSATD